ncbi:MAG: hypothetical protein PHF84_06060 [bacterium]|nr:hypothetical protein [bacterium]
MFTKIILILFFSSSLAAHYLYVDNFNDGSSPNLLGGAYGAYGYRGGIASVSYESNNVWGNYGKSLEFSFNVAVSNNSGAQIWMVFSPNACVNFTNYTYLRFYARGSTGNEMFRVMVRDTSGNYRSVDVRNYLPAGRLATTNRLVLIPLTAFRYNDCNETRITNFYIYVEHGMGADSGAVFLDEILFARGAGSIYVDNMETDESPYDNSALNFDVYKYAGNSGGNAYSFATNIMTNDSYSGSRAYCLKHITKCTNTQWAFSQSVWMFGYLNITPPLDVTACDQLRFFAKKGAGDTGGRRYIILGYDNSGSMAGMGHYELTGLTTSWQEYVIPLSVFSGGDLSRLLEFRLVSEWNSGKVTNITFLDEIRFVCSYASASPTNVRINGTKAANGSVLPRGLNRITATLFSNESLDKSLESVALMYTVHGSGVNRIVSMDYNTEKNQFTNIWDASGTTWTNQFDLMVLSMNSAVMRGPGFLNCRFNDLVNSFSVSLSNSDAAGIISFGGVSNWNTPKVARDSSGNFTCACVDYNVQNYGTGWKIIAYTDNSNSSASPRYTGRGNYLYGNLNDGTGLVGNGSGAASSNSTPLRVWCDAQDANGNFIRAPCEKWKGTGSGLQGVPVPIYQGGETNLFWKNQDLNGNNTNDNVIFTNSHWTEILKDYDAKGTGIKAIHQREQWETAWARSLNIPAGCRSRQTAESLSALIPLSLSTVRRITLCPTGSGFILASQMIWPATSVRTSSFLSWWFNETGRSKCKICSHGSFNPWGNGVSLQ